MIDELEPIVLHDAEGNYYGFIRPLVDWWVVDSGDKELNEARALDTYRRKLDADMAALKALGMWKEGELDKRSR